MPSLLPGFLASVVVVGLLPPRRVVALSERIRRPQTTATSIGLGQEYSSGGVKAAAKEGAVVGPSVGRSVLPSVRPSVGPSCSHVARKFFLQRRGSFQSGTDKRGRNTTSSSIYASFLINACFSFPPSLSPLCTWPKCLNAQSCHHEIMVHSALNA